MYKITKSKTDQTKGRVAILRNVGEEGRGIEPYATYRIMFETPDKDFWIKINRKMIVRDASYDIHDLIKDNGFKDVQGFADAYRDFDGYSE
tara:strand:+ start:899 stop:1171 length:273 start_codon:yes stop_codon:yes gene_type:complete